VVQSFREDSFSEANPALTSENPELSAERPGQRLQRTGSLSGGQTRAARTGEGLDARRGRLTVGFVLILAVPQLDGLAADRSGAKFTAVPGSSIVNVTAGAGRVKVQSQQAPGTARRAVDRYRARLLRGLGGQRTGPPRRVSAAAVLRRPDVRRTRDQGRDRMPRSLRGGAREAVRNRVCYIRRVARGQC
jgi:hypothetical protein